MQVLCSRLFLAALLVAGMGGAAAAQSVREVKAGGARSYGELRRSTLGQRVVRRLAAEQRRLTGMKLLSRRVLGPSLRQADRRLKNRELQRQREAREARLRSERKQKQAERSRAAAEHGQKKKKRTF